MRICVLFQTQQHKFVNWQCDSEYRGDDFTAAVTLGNPDILVGSGIFSSLISVSLNIHLVIQGFRTCNLNHSTIYIKNKTIECTGCKLSYT